MSNAFAIFEAKRSAAVSRAFQKRLHGVGEFRSQDRKFILVARVGDSVGEKEKKDSRY